MSQPASAPPTGNSVDLRLAFLAVGVWGSAIACLLGSVLTALIVASVATAVAWLSRHSRRVLPAIVSAMAIGACGGASVTGAQLLVRDAPALTQISDEHAAVKATVTVNDDPRRLWSQAEASFLVPATVHEVVADGVKTTLSADALVFATVDEPEQWEQLLPGQRLSVTGRPSPPRRAGDLTALVISTRQPPQLRGTPPWWQRAAGELRSGLRVACQDLPAGPAGLIPGLVVGDVSRLPPELAEDFRQTGLTHLVAVSGANVAIVVGAVVAIAAFAKAGRRTRMVIAIVAIGCFVIVARPSPSVLRAAVMGGIGVLAMTDRRGVSAIPTLSTAVVGLILFDPGLATNLGFVLSVLATGGLVLAAGPWARAWQRRGWPLWLAAALAVPLAAQLAVTPVLAAETGEISVVAVPANILAAAAVPPVTLLGAAATCLALWWPDAAAVLAWLAAWPAKWLILVAQHGSAVPSGAMPWPKGWWPALGLAVLLALAVWAVRSRGGRWCVAMLLVAVLLGLGVVRYGNGPWPGDGWVLVACDVGQGDALILPTGVDGSAIVVDAGADPGPVDECLRQVGIDHVALLVISHYHADHVAGVSGVYRGRDVAEVLASPDPLPAGGRRKLVEAAGSRPLTQVQPGTTLTVGTTRLLVLAAEARFHGTDSDANNNSLVLKATVSGVSILLSGDSEAVAQQALLDSGVDVDVDVLKVPHHGSATSAATFIEASSPAVAVISAGADNEYGHPHTSILRLLERVGAVVRRTDSHGAIAVIADADGLSVMHTGPSSS